MKHMMEFASWMWAMGEDAEKASLYLRPHESVFPCDLRSEITRWDRMYERYCRRDKRRRRKLDEAD